MNIYLKIFLITGIALTVFMGIFYAVEFGIVPGVVGGTIAGVLYGTFMSLILGSWHRWSVKRITSDRSEAAMKVRHLRNIELKLPYDRAFTLCIRSLDLIKKCQIKQQDRSQGKIVARTSMTWNTFGNVILFKVLSINEEQSRVEILSKPWVPTTLIDFGENLQNIATIADFIEKKSASVAE